MTDQPLARRPALVLLVVAMVVFAVAAGVLIPWDWLPGGHLAHVDADQVFTPAQIARAEHYSATVRHLAWLGYLLSLTVVVVLGFTPWGARLVRRIPRRLRVPGGVLVVLLAGRLVTLPVDLAIRHQQLTYGLTHQNLRGWLRDDLVGLAIAWVGTTVGVAVLLVLVRRSPRWWFAWGAGLAAAMTVVLSYLYPVMVEPLFNTFTPMPDGPLKQSILDLADSEGVPVKEVLVADASRRTTTLNAYVSGIGNTRRVVVYDNLLKDLTPAEVRVVVAHELGHAKHHDVAVGTALGAVGSVIGVTLLALMLDRSSLRRRAGLTGLDSAAIPLVLALAALGSFAVSPLQNTMSRSVEARADRASLLATRDERAFVQMQRQLAVTSLSDPTPPRWSQFWFGSHPTTLQRIGLAEAMLGEGPR